MLEPGEQYNFEKIENNDIVGGGDEDTNVIQAGYPIYRLIHKEEVRNAYIPFGLVHFQSLGNKGGVQYSATVRNKAMEQIAGTLSDESFEQLFSNVTKPLSSRAKTTKSDYRREGSVRKTAKR
jgi:hypothetical protein